MLEVLQFVFRGFWTFAGVCVLIAGTLNGIAEVIRAIRGKGGGDASVE